MHRVYRTAIIGLLIFLCLPHSYVYSQTNEQFNMLMFGFDYTTNTSTFGQLNTLAKQPSYAPGITFYSSYGFDASIAYYYLQNGDTSYSEAIGELDLSIGYTFDKIKNLTISPVYTHYFTDKASNTLKSFYTDNLQLDVQYELWKITLGLSGNYLFGEENRGYVIPGLSFLLEKDEFLNPSLYLALQPGVDFTFGKQTYYSNYYLDNLSRQPEELRKFLNEEQLWQEFFALRNQYPNLSRYQLLALIILNHYEVNERFNLNSVIFSLPVYIMIGQHWMVYMSTMFYQPSNAPKYLDNEGQLFFSAGISYSLSW